MMKTKRYLFMILFSFLMLLSCSKSDDADPLADFVGVYTTEAFQFRYVEINEGSVVMDTTLMVASHPNIHILRNNAPEEIDLELDGFIYTVINRIIEANESNNSIEIEPHDPFITTLYDNEFQLEPSGFNLKVDTDMGDEILESAISMTGTKEQEHLDMDFTISLENTKTDGLITGQAIGTKQ